ncbi:MAG: hypothetical protein EHM61_22740 [Acidobacteria bacterium]|nr:MAG: hypothetical protein EHM61_22740 [Acidobacteriota bacterium]
MNRLLLWLFALTQAFTLARGSGEQIELRDPEGRVVSPLRESDVRASVFIFTRTDCPISNRYAPELRRLYSKFAGRRIAFWLVYPGHKVSPAGIQAHLKEYAYPLPALQDPDHRLVKLTGVRVTPEVAVFAGSGAKAHLVYHGRIDDRFEDFGKSRPTATRHELEDVLQAILDGSPIATSEAPAVGCFIADLE